MCREVEELEPKQEETISVSINGPIDLELGLFYNRPNGPQWLVFAKPLARLMVVGVGFV